MDHTAILTSQQQQQPNSDSNSSFSSISQTLMHHQAPPPPSSTFASHFSRQPHTTLPNPFLSFPQPVLPSALTSSSDLHPPGTDPFANPGSYPSTNVEHGAHFQYYVDPNASSQNWVSEPIGYEAAINSLHENSIAPTSSSSLWSNYLVNQTLAKDATGIIPNQTDIFKSNRCDLCKIDCSGKEAYEKHIQGKRHNRNLQVQNNPTSTMLPGSSVTMSDIPSQVPSIDGQTIFGASGLVDGEEVETKKRKLLAGGAAVDSVRICSICNIACNSQEVFNKHLAGKKHASQARLISLNGVGPYIAAIRAQDGSIWKNTLKKNKVVQSAWCEVCKINCNSTDIYTKHLLGKKHQKNLEKLSKSNNDTTALTSNATPASTNPVIGPMENPEASKGNSVVPNSRKKVARSLAPEELEMKKLKILQGGAAAGAVRTCSICNVVCNSQTVFNSHLAGQKHAAMVKKQVEAGTATGAGGPQLITAA
ncbi:hypothetical protein I3843_11G049000 [Carya illinoinensis]|nr:zinc finger protein 346-like [Carya illinoinensis]KAG2679386.1 hypothetical protein I3760_11G048500 [Carya illinoinensis]KAG7954995.1 hypothetical protein I3843_11G049000 [Carya illinoinensis]